MIRRHNISDAVVKDYTEPSQYYVVGEDSNYATFSEKALVVNLFS